MKKVLVTMGLLVVLSTSANAQIGGLLEKAKNVASGAGYDVNGISNQLMTKLSPALSLTSDQKPKVSDIITNFLTEKSKILPQLAAGNTSAYSAKQTTLFASLKNKLTGILLQNQLKKFMALKPATNTPSNIVSQLFY